MKKTLQNRGLYQLKYGYSNHAILFVESKENIQMMLEVDYQYEIETSKHSSEEVRVKDAILVSINQAFINRFIELELNSSSPYEYYLDEISE